MDYPFQLELVFFSSFESYSDNFYANYFHYGTYTKLDQAEKLCTTTAFYFVHLHIIIFLDDIRQCTTVRFDSCKYIISISI